MRVVQRLFVATTAFAVAACGALLSLEPLDFVEDAGVGTDGDAPSADSPASDAPIDRADAADAADAALCASDAYDFCDDFDGERSLQDKWSAYGQAGTGALAIEAGVLLGEMHTAASANGHYAALIIDVPWTQTGAGARRHVLVQFRARIDVCPGPATPYVQFAGFGLNGSLVGLQFGDQAGACIVLIEQVVISDAGAAYQYSGTLLAPALGTWESYELELAETPVGSPGLATIRVGATKTTSLVLTPVVVTNRYYQLFGVSQGTLAGVEAKAALDDFRADFLK